MATPPQAATSQSIAQVKGGPIFPAEALLDRVTAALSEMGASDALIKVVLAEGRRVIQARDIYLLLREDGQLTLRGALGLERDPDEVLRVADGWGIEGQAIAQARPVFIYDARVEPGYKPIPGRRGATGAMVAVPLRLRGEPIGVVSASRSQAGWFTEREVRWLTTLAQMAAVAIENERLRAAEQQQARLRAREEFLAVVSHELKTPVAVIKAYVEVLHRRAVQSHATQADLDVLEHVREQADRMLAMIEELLDLQRLGIGQMDLELSRFDLCSLARRVLEGVQVATETHKLEYSGPKKPLYVVADRKRIEEVITNLLDNAVKYSAGGTEVLLRVVAPRKGRGGQEAIVSVTDWGIGIVPEEQDQVFERFYQASGAPVRGHVGLGLGLYITREIVHRHGGRVWLESQPGRGSSFFVSLPISGPPTGEE